MTVIVDEAALREAERALQKHGFSHLKVRRLGSLLRGLTSEELTTYFRVIDPIARTAVRRWLIPPLHTVVEVIVDRAIANSKGPPPLLDIKAVARRLNVSERSVERLIASGHIVPLWIGESRRFAPEAIEAFLRRYAVRGRSRKKA